jgi:hypothetical protein
VAEPETCAICEKHRGEGPLGGELVVEDEHLLAFYTPASAEEPAYLGWRVDDWPGAPQLWEAL